MLRRLGRLLRSVADRFDPPGFEYRLDFGKPGEVIDWSKVADELGHVRRRV